MRRNMVVLLRRRTKAVPRSRRLPSRNRLLPKVLLRPESAVARPLDFSLSRQASGVGGGRGARRLVNLQLSSRVFSKALLEVGPSLLKSASLGSLLRADLTHLPTMIYSFTGELHLTWKSCPIPLGVGTPFPVGRFGQGSGPAGHFDPGPGFGFLTSTPGSPAAAEGEPGAAHNSPTPSSDTLEPITWRCPKPGHQVFFRNFQKTENT